MPLDRNALLAAIGPLPREEVPIPGGTVIVQGLSATEKDEWEESCVIDDGKRRKPNLRDMRAKLLVRCLINPDGSRIFSEADIPLIGKWSTGMVDRLCEVAERLSAVKEEDFAELKKNSEAIMGGSSSSNSPTSGDSPTPTS